MQRDDRRVHARTSDGWEIVRYDRAGKWFRERSDGSRRPLNLQNAVHGATRPGSEVFYGVPGGQRFDAALRKHYSKFD